MAWRAQRPAGTCAHLGPGPPYVGRKSGDVKPVGSGVSEMRIDYGPGYRVYFVNHGKTVVILLCGGDKRTQARDIARAIEMSQRI